MKNLDDLIKDGFYVSEVKDNRENIADYSLLGSLKSYFSTAEDLDRYLSTKDYIAIGEKESKEILVGAYAIDACNAITQFQHFFELFLKDILLEHSKLLVYDASKKRELFIKLIDKENISDAELDGMNFIECSEAIERIKTLNKTGKLNSKYQFIVDYFELFENLNRLRNRITHRGAFIINPSALDEIFGRYVIPFVNELESVKGYGNIKSWNFNLKTNELDPFETISKEYLNGQVDENKIHLFKLIGDASYKNKLNFDLDIVLPFINDEIREQAKISAQVVAEQNNCHDTFCQLLTGNLLSGDKICYFCVRKNPHYEAGTSCQTDFATADRWHVHRRGCHEIDLAGRV